MSELALDYLFFLARVATVVAALGLVLAMAGVISARHRIPDRLRVRRLNDRYDDFRRSVEAVVLSRGARRTAERARRRERRTHGRGVAERRRIFVLGFRGDLRASRVAALREEITAILRVARPGDEVVVRLENAGGLVQDHGFAASQLVRLKQGGLRLTVAVDKVAASGGYLMACVADRILAAPFALLGSIGVVLQLPNFHRFLDQRGVDFELIKGGEHKRNLTLFGENTDEDRARARRDVEDIHALFKEFVAEHRPALDLGRVATGEVWFGRRALDVGLCDELRTSDDHLLAASAEADVVELSLIAPRSLGRRLASAVEGGVDAILDRWWQGSRAGR